MKTALHVSILFFVFTSSSPSLSSAKLSLKQAIRNGVLQDQTLASLTKEKKISLLKIKLSESARRFSVQSRSSYLYTSDTMGIEIPLPGNGSNSGSSGTSIKNQSPHHNIDISVSLTQPLYSGGVLKNQTAAARFHSDLIDLRSDLLVLDTVYHIKESFILYQIRINERAATETLLSQLKLHRSRIDEFVREKILPESDLVETENRILEAQLNLADTQKQLRLARNRFVYHTSLDPDRIENDSFEPALSKTDALKRLKRSHPYLKSLRIRERLGDRKKQLISGRYKPHINAFTELHTGRPGVDFFSNDWSVYLKAGFTFQYKIFDWNRKSRETAMEQLAIDKIDHERKRFIRQSERMINDLYVRLDVLNKQLSLMNAIVENSKKISAVKRALYFEKQISNKEYLDSLMKLNVHKFKVNTLRYRIITVRSAIVRSIGMKEEEKG